ncbi:MAG: TIGR01244 family sulfur transferase [Alphaproteobacteria bacterium]
MVRIIQIEEHVGITGQLHLADVRDLAAEGVKYIINNRPDGEVSDQPLTADLAAEAERLGVSFFDIPFVYPAPAQIIEFADVLKDANGLVVVYCRSGQRSTILWAAAKMVLGTPIDEVVAMAKEADVDLERAATYIVDLAKEAAKTQ